MSWRIISWRSMPAGIGRSWPLSSRDLSILALMSRRRVSPLARSKSCWTKRRRAPRKTFRMAARTIPIVGDMAVSRVGEVWQAGRHRLICGDARDKKAYEALLGIEQVDLIFTDPPYNVAIDGHVCGLGRVRHRDFAMGVGEMSSAEFTTFLEQTLGAAAQQCRDGAIAFICMDWRHLEELLAAGKVVFSELKHLCVWNKSSAGMGTFYRSKYEMVFVFKIGTAPHSFGLGETGRPRSNVWDYPGVAVSGLVGWRSSRCVRPSSRQGS